MVLNYEKYHATGDVRQHVKILLLLLNVKTSKVTVCRTDQQEGLAEGQMRVARMRVVATEMLRLC